MADCFVGRSAVTPTLGTPTSLVIVERASAAKPLWSEEEAGHAALEKLRSMEPSLTGLAIAASRHSGSLLRAEDADGRLISSQSEAMNAWVFEVSAPPTKDYASVQALVIVDAVTGEVEAAQILQTNEP